MCGRALMHCCRYESAAPTQGATVDCGLFVIGYAIAKLRGLPLQLLDPANMPAMREALVESRYGDDAGVCSCNVALYDCGCVA